MTGSGPLFETQSPTPLLLLEAEPQVAANALLAWDDAGLTARSVRGGKMRTLDGLFDETAAALQFPHYFGENWPAFDECLCDMDWLPMGVGIVVLIFASEQVLADEPDEMTVLVRMIANAASAYSQPIDKGEWWDRPAVPFHIVLQCSPASAAAARGRWQAAGATLSDLVS
jgi:Barstar (barnase inhibitor)